MKYPVLQSGFVSLVDKGLKLPEVIAPGVKDLILDKESKNPLNRYYYSDEITDLFAIWSNNPNCLKKFEYRERLIKAAYKTFGTRSFYDWINQQKDRATIGQVHVAFLAETLEYLATDKPRQTQTILWYRIVTANESSVGVNWELSKYFVQQPGQSKTLVPMLLEKLLAQWFAKTNGFEDLLITLYTIFGARTARLETSKEDVH